MRLDKQRRIYKINTSLLKKHKWNLDMPLHKAMKEHPELIVTIADSQLMRWIDKINAALTESKALYLCQCRNHGICPMRA